MKNLALNQFDKNGQRVDELSGIGGIKSLTTLERRSILGGEVPSANSSLLNDTTYFLFRFLKAL